MLNKPASQLLTVSNLTMASHVNMCIPFASELIIKAKHDLAN